MDFSYTQEQQMLRDGVSKFLEKSYDFDARQDVVRSDAAWSNEAWNQYAEFGLLALPFPEEKGGLGGTMSDCIAVAQIFGEHLVVEPFVPSILLVGGALARSDNAAAHEWIEKLASGESVGAFAYEEGRGIASPSQIAMAATPSDGGFVLSGEKRLVLAGGEADILIVAARRSDTGNLALVMVERGAAGLNTRQYLTVDGRSAANITFDNVKVGDGALVLDDAEDALEQLIGEALIVMSAEAVGAMSALMAITSDYAITRKQFGQPIAAFQAVAHRLADMKIARSKALATLTYTAALADSFAATARDIAIMKGQIGKLGKALGEAAIQTHGGVGMTDELSVNHYHKRLLAYDRQFGDHAYHLRKVGQR